MIYGRDIDSVYYVLMRYLLDNKLEHNVNCLVSKVKWKDIKVISLFLTCPDEIRPILIYVGKESIVFKSYIDSNCEWTFRVGNISGFTTYSNVAECGRGELKIKASTIIGEVIPNIMNAIKSID